MRRATRIPTLTTLLLLLAAVLPLQGAFRPADIRQGLRIEPSRTRVGLASVYLEVSDLTLSGGRLTGRYSIRVPLFPSKNDEGSVQLSPAPDTAPAFVGHAHSDEGGAFRQVRCEILDEDSLRIAITTDDRTLVFTPRYSVASRL